MRKSMNNVAQRQNLILMNEYTSNIPCENEIR